MAEKVIKEDIIKAVAQRAEITKADSKRVVEAVIDEMTEQLQKGNHIVFVGFGSFKVVDTAPKKGRNIKTGETIEIPAGKKIKFTAGKELKNSIQ